MFLDPVSSNHSKQSMTTEEVQALVSAPMKAFSTVGGGTRKTRKKRSRRMMMKMKRKRKKK